MGLPVKRSKSEVNAPRSGSREYYKRIADGLRMLKWASLISVFVLVTATFILYRHEMTLENLRYIMRYVNFDIGTDYRASNQISFKAEAGTKYAYLKGDLAMVSPTRFSIYEFTGQPLVDDRISYLNPAIKTSGRYAVIYDVTGSDLALYNSNGCLFEKDFDFGIRDVALRSDGIFAVVGHNVSVYGADYRPIYELKLVAGTEIIAASLPDSARRLDALLFHAVDGDFRTYLRSYDLRSSDSKPVHEVTYIGEYPLRLVSDKDSVVVLTDKMIHFYNGELELLREYPIVSTQLKSFYDSGDFVAVTLSNDVLGSRNIRVFSRDGREMNTDGLRFELYDLASEGGNLYFLEKGRLHIKSVDKDTGALYDKSVIDIDTNLVYKSVFAISPNKYVLVSDEGAGKFE